MNERDIFIAALQIEAPAERSTYLDQACGDDVSLRQRVAALLAALGQAGSFLLQPAADPGATSEGSPPGLVENGVPAASLEEPGTVLGRYKLLERVGEGGMGTVWMAQQTEPVKRLVAVKLIKPGMDSKQVLARFEAERQALALMDHPNIAKVHDAGTTPDGRPFFVMELVKGVLITKYCDEHRLTPRQRLELFVPVCQAIQHAHQKGIIHRDLKPSNVLVARYDDRPVPKVIDFGVAKAAGQPLTDKTLVTGFGAIVGTLEYMSPEQARLDNLDIDTRSDVYALGVLLYELLTGTTPHQRKALKEAALFEMLRVIREEEPPKPSLRLSTAEELPSIAASRGLDPKKLSGVVRGELDWIVMKALEKERGRRYETADGLARDIERYLHDEPVEACPPSAGYKLLKLAHKHRAALLTAVGFVLLLTTGAAVSAWQAVAATRAKQGALAAAEAERTAKDQAVAAAAAEKEAKEAEAAQRGRAEQAEALAKARLAEVTKEKERADEEARITLAVNEFLQELLRQADVRNQRDDLPGRLVSVVGATIGATVRDRDIKVRTLLDRAANQVGRKFAQQPLVEASIRFTLGNAYSALGEFAEAEQHLARCTSLRKKKLGADHADTLAAMNSLAVLDHQRGRYDEAEPLFKQALEGYRRMLGADDPVTLIVMNNLAALYMVRGRYDEAERLFKQSLESLRHKLGDSHPATFPIMSNLAQLYQYCGRLGEAESLCKQVLEPQTRTLGADHPDTLTSLHHLARLYRQHGRYDEAERLYQQLLKGCRRTFGADHPHTFVSTLNLAELYLERGQCDAAEPLLKQARQGLQQKLGPDHPDTLASMNDLAMLYHKRFRDDEAESLWKQVLETRRRTLGAEHQSTLVTLNNLGVLYVDCRRYGEAEPLLKQLVQTQRRTLGADHPDTIRTTINLAGLYGAMNKKDQSIALFEEALKLSGSKLGADHPMMLRARKELGVHYCLAGKLQDGVRCLEQALAAAGKRPGSLRAGELAAMSRELATACSLAGLNMLRHEKYADAEKVLRQCLAIRTKQAPDAWTTFNAKSLLGEALAGQKKHADAEPLLVQGYEGMKQREATLPPEAKFRLTEALERLVHFYDGWDRKDQADKWRKQLQARKKESGVKSQEPEKK